jgi:hypothetical protein
VIRLSYSAISEYQFGDDRLPVRFWAKAVVDEATGCWLWTAQIAVDGYARFKHRFRTNLAYRLAYEVLAGPVPDEQQLDHLCRVRRCVNPAHLEVVSQQENILRGEGLAAQNARKTECLRGHPLHGENLNLYSFIRPNGRPSTQRRCRACQRERCRRSG